MVFKFGPITKFSFLDGKWKHNHFRIKLNMYLTYHNPYHTKHHIQNGSLFRAKITNDSNTDIDLFERSLPRGNAAPEGWTLQKFHEIKINRQINDWNIWWKNCVIMGNCHSKFIKSNTNTFSVAASLLLFFLLASV